MTASPEITGQIREAVRFIRSRIKAIPKVSLILGSGLGDFADIFEPSEIIDSSQVPHFPVASVQGHAGSLVFGVIRENDRVSLPLLVFKGRTHFYEVNDLHKVIMPTAVAAGLGVKKLLVTNAAGGINSKYYAGDLMLIRDILNFSFENIPPVSPTRRDTSTLPHVRQGNGSIFDDQLQQTIRSAAADNSIRMHEGTYCWVKGPSYETAAEIQMLKRFGADAVGMSTVPEIVTAHRLGMRVAGISLISNLATGISASKLSHAEVTETANRVKVAFTTLMKDAVLRLR